MMEEFLDRKVRIIRNSDGFQFTGTLKSTNSIGVTLNDRKCGLMFVPFVDIYEIQEVR